MDEPADVFGSFGVSLDREALECWKLAAELGDAGTSDSRVSYTSLLLALLEGGNAISQWLGAYAENTGVDRTAMEREVGLSPGSIEIVRERPPPRQDKNETRRSRST
jgi:hypothetical protein